MKKLGENQEYQLTVEFLNKTTGNGRVLRSAPSGQKWTYSGKTKTEAIAKATAAGRYNSSYSKTFEIVEA